MVLKEPRTRLMWQQVSEEEEEETNGVEEQSGDKKVPVLTISLRPGKQTRNLPSTCLQREHKNMDWPCDTSGILPELVVIRLL